MFFFFPFLQITNGSVEIRSFRKEGVGQPAHVNVDLNDDDEDDDDPNFFAIENWGPDDERCGVYGGGIDCRRADDSTAAAGEEIKNFCLFGNI